jgi:hypothetical protein
MQNNAPLSHEVTRRLTKPWEFGDRLLFYFDFEKNDFGEESSRTLLTAAESYGFDVERLLNEKIENPLANYLDGLANVGLVTDIQWRQERAVLLSLVLQSARVVAARGDTGALDQLRSIVSQDDVQLDAMAGLIRRDWRTIGVRLGAQTGELCFPSVGLAALPLVGTTRPVWFQPTSLRTLFALVPTDVPEASTDEQIRAAMANHSVIAFSIGLDVQASRPPAGAYSAPTRRAWGGDHDVPRGGARPHQALRTRDRPTRGNLDHPGRLA